jgi:hypothetical protein
MTILANLRTSVLARLGDFVGVRFTGPVIDSSISQALAEFSAYLPQIRSYTHTVVSAGRKQSIAAITEYQYVLEVWYPVTLESDGERQAFYSHYNGAYLVLDFPTINPAIDQVLIIRYTQAHTIEGLDQALVTTVSPAFYSLLVQGAAGLAAISRSSMVTEAPNKRVSDTLNIKAWGRTQHDQFLAALLSYKLALDTGSRMFPPSGFALDNYDNNSLVV